MACAEQATVTPGSAVETNCAAVPAGWLQVPGREVVLDVRSQGVEYSNRRDAGEFLLSILNALLQAGYTVRLSDGFLQDEIVYYSLNQEREKPTAMSRGILDCLHQARKSQVLDWDCFKAIARSSGDMLSSARNLPWMSPPVNSAAVGMAGAGTTNLPQLHLRMRWQGAPVLRSVQISGWHTTLPRQGALMSQQAMAWNFAAELRLEQGAQVLFAKDYPQEPWPKESISAAEMPLERSIQTILQDLDTGLKPKPEAPPPPKGKKSRKRG